MRLMLGCLAISIALTVHLPAQEVPIKPLYALGETHYYQVTSEALDRTYHIYVRVPASSDRAVAHPTIYLLDGGVTFPLLAGYFRYLRAAQSVPEAIIVGISYGSPNFEEGNLRSTDFTMPSPERSYWGGAQAFATFLENNLFPLIESEYPSDPDKRVIFGQSLGGQFVLFAAQHRPGLFWGHIASNPALHRNLESFLRVDQAATMTPARVFVSSGSEDDPRFRRPARSWMDYWTTQATPPWPLRAVTLEGHDHYSAAPESFRQGLLWIFE